MSADFRLDRAAIQALMTGPEVSAFMGDTGRSVRDRARANALPITDKVDAIVHEVGLDSQGIYVDVGYAKHHPGFFLWWWEVGTRNHAARPHLRPALVPGSVGSGSSSAAARELVDYTTKAGVTRKATRAQVANWTRSSQT